MNFSKLKLPILAILILMFFTPALAQDNKYIGNYDEDYTSLKHTKRLKEITSNLNCIMCKADQNYNLYTDSSPMAKEYRENVLSMIQKNFTNEKIYQYINDDYNGIITYGIDDDVQLYENWVDLVIISIFALLIFLVIKRQKNIVTKQKEE